MAKKFAVHLPDEILTVIFLRLEVISLLICKSVCKTWLSIISNPHFVKSQLHRAIMNPTLLIIDYEAENYLSISRRRGNTYKQFTLPWLLEDCEVISSYNGIICLCDDDDVFYLWNPSIEKFKRLPPAPRRGSSSHKTGFGYDSISDDYKILRIVDDDIRDVMPKVYLYSTNANCWIQFLDHNLKRLSGTEQNDIVVNGVLYIDNGDELISFDLHKEVLGLVQLPSFMDVKMSNVLDFEGSVAMVFKCVGDAEGIYLWTLDDVSGQMHWTKTFRIYAGGSRLWLYFYLGAGHFYGRMSLHSFFFHNILYDYETEETINCGVRDNVCATLKYAQTLVWF